MFKVQLSRVPMILYGLHGLHSLKLPNSQRHVFFLSLPNAYITLHHGKLCFFGRSQPISESPKRSLATDQLQGPQNRLM